MITCPHCKKETGKLFLRKLDFQPTGIYKDIECERCGGIITLQTHGADYSELNEPRIC